MKKFMFLFAVLTLGACSPAINYLGDIRTPTDSLDVYYDEGDINVDYRVMGQLTADNSNNSFLNLDKIKEKMIVEAKKKGADGILFLHHESFQNQHIVMAKLLEYK